MSKDLTLTQEIYVMDNSPEFEDTTFIKIDYFNDDNQEELLETNFTELDVDVDKKKEVDFKTPKSQTTHKDQQSISAKCNSRVKAALSRLGSKGSSFQGACAESEEMKHSVLFEFIKVLTCGAQIKLNKNSIKTSKTKNMRLRYKARGKKNMGSVDSCDSQTCSGSENGRVCA